MKIILSLSVMVLTLFSGCKPKQHVNLIIAGGPIYSVNERFEVYDAMAVSNGRIVALGKEAEILERYSAKKVIRLKMGEAIFPGFIDAHCHFYGYGLLKGLSVDLRGAASWEEVLGRLERFRKDQPLPWLQGRGWDQNDWPGKTFPDKTELDKRFPDVPVFLVRIDGHAALANSRALDMAGIGPQTRVQGGEVVLKNGQPTGLLLDNAMDLVRKNMPDPDEKSMEAALLEAQSTCFSYGLTGVTDAGLDNEVVHLVERMSKEGSLSIRINAMLTPDSANVREFLNRHPRTTNSLSIRAIKLYADGALGSRGARLSEPYTDAPQSRGLWVDSSEKIDSICKQAYANGFQVCTHCIGDEATRRILGIYGKYLREPNDLRWRIEHAQVVHPEDLALFQTYSVIPSIQATHATSDMSWAGERLGPERVKTAYAYADLLKTNGWLPNGTDFPIEEVNPLLTFYASVARKDLQGNPPGGFQTENALTREQALRSMTHWAAMSEFREHHRGILAPGYFADFVILSGDMMTLPIEEVPTLKVVGTYLNGKKVYAP